MVGWYKIHCVDPSHDLFISKISKPSRYLYWILLFTSIYILLVACQSSKPDQNPTVWVYTDLRAISANFTDNPSNDVVAAYTRESGSDIQIRLDWLDITRDFQSEIYIALDTQPGGTTYLPLDTDSILNWDTLIKVPAHGSPVAYNPATPGELKSQLTIREDVVPRAFADIQNDYVVISLNKFVFPEHSQIFQAEVFLKNANSKQIDDRIGPFRFDDSPNYRLPVLFAFFNVFPAYTPAQALRRWDGAHTGPLGERHGLKLLLQAMEQYNIPVTLLDLRASYSLSALDYLGQLQTIRKLAVEQLITLPDYLPGNVININNFDSAGQEFIKEWARGSARQISQEFEISPSFLLFTPQLPAYEPLSYQTIFTLSQVESKPFLWGNALIIPIQENRQEQQISRQGLSLDIRKALLKSFENGVNDNSNIFILGGNLPQSNWGDQESVDAAMKYIAEHPWIKPLNTNGIMAIRKDVSFSNSAFLDPFDSGTQPTYHFDVSNQITVSNKELVENPVLSAALQSYLSLFSPLPPETDILYDLRKKYFNQIGHFLNAAKWAEQPFLLSTCDTDPDNDGQNECILSSEHYYAVFEKAGARLILLFIRSNNEASRKFEVHQVLGPTSQFLVGIGDPGTWHIEAGESADSGGTHGAFFDSLNSWNQYTPSLVSPDHITFSSLEGSITKSYTFNENSMVVEYTNVPSMIIKIPLVLDPWIRFSSAWGDRYWHHQTLDGWIWGISEGPEVEITSNGKVKLHPFTSSQDTLNERENPNFEYPPGHFIPFPIAIAEVGTNSDSASLIIQLGYP